METEASAPTAPAEAAPRRGGHALGAAVGLVVGLVIGLFLGLVAGNALGTRVARAQCQVAVEGVRAALAVARGQRSAAEAAARSWRGRPADAGASREEVQGPRD